MRSLGFCLLSLLTVTCQLYGQIPHNKRGRGQPPVPIWTGSGETGPSSTKHDVFLSEDGQQLIVLVPDEEGNRIITRVRLWNDVSPLADQVMRSLGPGLWAYHYSIGNSSSATDPIGTWALVIPPSPLAAKRVLSPQGQKLWGGTATSAVIFRQELLNSDELGRIIRWFYHQEGSQVRPGETVGGFEIESSFLPGFTTAWFAAGKTVKFDQSWPARIFKQLELLEDKKWRGRGLLTIGPMFPSDTPMAKIQSNYLSGLNQMIKDGRLDGQSAFTLELLRALAESDPGGLNGRIVSAVPNGPLETSILAAVELSLGITGVKK